MIIITNHSKQPSSINIYRSNKHIYIHITTYTSYINKSITTPLSYSTLSNTFKLLINKNNQYLYKLSSINLFSLKKNLFLYSLIKQIHYFNLYTYKINLINCSNKGYISYIIRLINLYIGDKNSFI